MFARGPSSGSSRKGHNFCFTAQTGEEMNGKTEHPYCLEADTETVQCYSRGECHLYLAILNSGERGHVKGRFHPWGPMVYLRME